ncbi:MAG TPA: hypothetical protein VE974_21465 [Thermoanaerobaculia bacterium]|nr:hypothetical protein [Thermoanaerobaculia bacterium]
MPKDTREPQSYGSEKDWVTGKTGQEVNDQDSAPAPEHAEFYDERRESESSGPVQGGLTSPVQLAENAQAAGHSTVDDDSPLSGVTTTHGGAKRGGFFKKRDYE